MYQGVCESVPVGCAAAVDRPLHVKCGLVKVN
jgi:hypothetical protein